MSPPALTICGFCNREEENNATLSNDCQRAVVGHSSRSFSEKDKTKHIELTASREEDDVDQLL